MFWVNEQVFQAGKRSLGPCKRPLTHLAHGEGFPRNVDEVALGQIGERRWREAR